MTGFVAAAFKAGSALGTGDGFNWLFYNNGQVGTTFATVTISADSTVATIDRPFISVVLADGAEIWLYNDDTNDKPTAFTAEKSGSGATDYTLGTESICTAATATHKIWGAWRISATTALVATTNGVGLNFTVVTADFGANTVTWGTINTTLIAVASFDGCVCQIDDTTWAAIYSAASTTIDGRYITVSGTTVTVAGADTNLVGSLTNAGPVIGVSCSSTRIGILYMVNTTDIHGRLVSCVGGAGSALALVASNSLTVVDDNSGSVLETNLDAYLGRMKLAWRDTTSNDVFLVGTAPMNSTIVSDIFFGAWYDSSADTWRNLYNGTTTAELEELRYLSLGDSIANSILYPIRGNGKSTDMNCLSIGLLMGATDTVPPALSFFYLEPNLVDRATSSHRMPPLLQSNFGKISDASNALTTSNRVFVGPSNTSNLNELTLLVNDNGALKYKRLTIPS